MTMFFQSSVGINAVALSNVKKNRFRDKAKRKDIHIHACNRIKSSIIPVTRGPDGSCPRRDTVLRHNAPWRSTSLQLCLLTQFRHSSRRHRTNTLRCCCCRRNCRLQSTWEIHNVSWGRCTSTAKQNCIHVSDTVNPREITQTRMSLQYPTRHLFRSQPTFVQYFVFTLPPCTVLGQQSPPS